MTRIFSNTLALMTALLITLASFAAATHVPATQPALLVGQIA